MGGELRRVQGASVNGRGQLLCRLWIRPGLPTRPS